MANSWHVEWLSEGVSRWNKRRKKVDFVPDLTGIRFFEHLPPDFRDEPKTSRYFEKIDLSNANLAEADLSDLNFSGANFTNADLRGANLSKSNFQNAKFVRAKLDNVNATRALLENTRFETASLNEVNFHLAEMDDAVFINTDLSENQREIIGTQHIREYESAASFKNEIETSSNTSVDAYQGMRILKSLDEGKTSKIKYDVYFGTTRTPVVERGAVTGFSAVASSGLNFGLCEVIIPDDYSIGSNGSKLWKKLWNKKEGKLEIDSLIPLSEELFWSHLIKTADKMKEKARPTVFVHGFNNSFEDAILRAAQVGLGLGIGQGIGLFSWTSRGDFSKYDADVATVDSEAYALAIFLERFVSNGSEVGINVIAHSMGCRCLLGAMEILAGRVSPALPYIHEVILAAADVDARVMPLRAPATIKYSNRTTSYVSDKDRALKLSGWKHDFPRVGLTPPTFTMKGLDTILVNDLSVTDFISHAYVAESREVVSDMFSILKNNLSPSLRHGLEAVSAGGSIFWKFKK